MHRRRQMLGTCPGATWYPVLEGECDMRVPQVSERIKEAPAQALRGVFAGIGQLLLITDKLRNKASHQDVPRARTPEASETVTDTTVTSPADRQSSRNFDKTGNVRVIGDEADSPAVSAAAEPAAAPEPAAAAPEPAAPAAESAAAAAPLPNYDELSVASLRARLRNLDVAQVRQFAEYERTHAARADVLSMFERRIAKLEAEA